VYNRLSAQSGGCERGAETNDELVLDISWVRSSRKASELVRRPEKSLGALRLVEGASPADMSGLLGQ
jgi:hypothetical protein